MLITVSLSRFVPSEPLVFSKLLGIILRPSVADEKHKTTNTYVVAIISTIAVVIVVNIITVITIAIISFIATTE